LEINVDLNVNKVVTCRPQCFPGEADRTAVKGIMGILGMLLVRFRDKALASGCSSSPKQSSVPADDDMDGVGQVMVDVDVLAELELVGEHVIALRKRVHDVHE
jgi:hypothetical protein